MWELIVTIMLGILVCGYGPMIAIMMVKSKKNAGNDATVGLYSRWQKQRQKPKKKQPAQFDYTAYSFQPVLLNHGTRNLKVAMDILDKNRWLIERGDAVWMTSDFDTAKFYAGSDGAIVQLMVSPTVALSNLGAGVYTAPVQKAKRGKYYRINGVTPISVLDTQGQQIAP